MENDKKTVRLFGIERRYVNDVHRYVEVERIIVVGEETRLLGPEDVAKGLNFQFVPLDSLIAQAPSSPLSESFKRVLRMNFEASLINLRQYAAQERDQRLGNFVAAPMVQMHDDILRMYLPPDLQCPRFRWDRVNEPEGHVPAPIPNAGSQPQKLYSHVEIANHRYQDSMSRIMSGAVCPNGVDDLATQRNNVNKAVSHLAADREALLRQGGTFSSYMQGPYFVSAVPKPMPQEPVVTRTTSTSFAPTYSGPGVSFTTPVVVNVPPRMVHLPLNRSVIPSRDRNIPRADRGWAASGVDRHDSVTSSYVLPIRQDQQTPDVGSRVDVYGRQGVVSPISSDSGDEDIVVEVTLEEVHADDEREEEPPPARRAKM